MKRLMELWSRLDDRQKKLTMVAGGVVTCLLYYAVIWEPIHDSVVQLRQDIHNDQDLLVWMKQAQTQLKRRNKVTHDQTSSNTSILALTENSIQSANLSGLLKEIKQEGEGVLVRFDNVSYVDFLKWLSDFQSGYGIKIDRVKLQRTANPGVINVNLQLERSS